MHVSRQIYRRIHDLFPDLSDIKPFERTDLRDKGLPDVNVVVFETGPQQINFILSQYRKENGRTIADPCFEIALNPSLKTANVVTYKDSHYFHAVTPEAEEIGTMAMSQANGLLYAWLNELQTVAPIAIA